MQSKTNVFFSSSIVLFKCCDEMHAFCNYRTGEQWWQSCYAQLRTRNSVQTTQHPLYPPLLSHSPIERGSMIMKFLAYLVFPLPPHFMARCRRRRC
jgi:hypothetical protein